MDYREKLKEIHNNKKHDEKSCGDVFKDLEKAMDAREMSMAMRKVVAKAVLERVVSGDMGGGDLVRLMGMLNERIDGKVADKVEHSGVIGLEAVLAAVTNKSMGLPKPEWFEQAIDVGYDEVVLAAEVAGSDKA
jgi:hypothetical protein